jgi:hypothetical protein
MTFHGVVARTAQIFEAATERLAYVSNRDTWERSLTRDTPLA